MNSRIPPLALAILLTIPALAMPAAAQAPRVVLLAPNGGEEVDDVCLVTWSAWSYTAPNDSLSVNLYYKVSGDTSWTAMPPIDAEGKVKSKNDGVYAWNTSGLRCSPFYFVKINVTDGSSTGTDTSDNFFAISAFGKETNVSCDPAASKHPTIELTGDDDVQVIWDEGMSELYYAKVASDNRIVTPKTLVQSGGAALYRYPDSAIDADGITHLVVEVMAGTNYVPYYYRMDNSTVIFKENPYPFGLFNSHNPKLAVGPDCQPVMAWFDDNTGSNEIWLAKLDSAGNNVAGGRVTWLGANSKYPDVAVDSSNNIFLAWQTTAWGGRELAFNRYGWGVLQLTSGHQVGFPAIAVDNRSNSHIVWDDTKDGHREVYYMMVNQFGIPLIAPTALVLDGNDSQYPSIAVDRRGMVHIAWQDARDGNYELYYTVLDPSKHPRDGSAGDPCVWNDTQHPQGLRVWEDMKLTSSGAYSYFPAIRTSALSCETMVAYQDSRSGAEDIYYRHFTPNILQGTVLDGNGHVLESVNVTLYADGKRLDSTFTRGGKFSFIGPDIYRGSGKKYSLNITLEDEDGIMEMYDYKRTTPEKIYLMTKDFELNSSASLTRSIVFPGNSTLFDAGFQNGTPGVYGRMADFATSYHWFYKIIRFAQNKGITLDYTPVRIYEREQFNASGGNEYSFAYWLGNVTSIGGGTASTIHIGEGDTWSDAPEHPDNCEWHEFGHHIMADTMDNTLNYYPGRVNHAGHANANTGDSLNEGFAEFLSAMVSEYYGDPAPNNYTGGWFSGNRWVTNLEDNCKPWPVATDEEWSVAGILYDLVDGHADIDNAVWPGRTLGDHVNLSFETFWSVFSRKGSFSLPGYSPYDPGEASLGYIYDVKDLYDAFRNSGLVGNSDNDGINDLDELFIMHGAFNDTNGNGRYDAGERVGVMNSTSAGQPAGGAPRHNTPLVDGSFVRASGLDVLNGTPVTVGNFTVELRYPPTYGYLDMKYELALPDPVNDSLLYLRVPQDMYNATAYVYAHGPAGMSRPLTLNESAYAKALLEGKGYLLDYTFCFSEPPVPKAPVLSVANVTSGSVTLKWSRDNDTNFDRYELRRAADQMVNESSELVFAGQCRTNTSYADTNLSENSDLHYRMYVHNLAGGHNSSGEVSARTSNAVPPGVALCLTEAGTSWATVAWEPPEMADFLRCEVHLSRTGNFTPSNGTLFAAIANLETTSYNLTGLSDNTTYRIRLRLVDSGNLSSVSNELAVTTLVRPAEVVIPVELSATDVGIDYLLLRWTGSTDPLFANYTVMSVTAGGNETVGVVADRAITELNVTGLSENTTYRFLVRLHIASGAFADSNELEVRTLPAVPEPPPDLPPVLADASVDPASGNTSLVFTFSVLYSDPEGRRPLRLALVLDNISYNLENGTNTGDFRLGVKYVHSIHLGNGTHSFSFTASDGRNNVSSGTGYVVVRRPDAPPPPPPPPVTPAPGEGGMPWLPALLAVAGTGAALTAAFVLLRARKKKRKRDGSGEE